ncbi:GAF domain-containing sensor histidine kinase [Actinopolymorpha alba]|uniref:GAF domain-containing sensor histidine kinase n=1 Tax=Actinopolymorpha alba TaxID=533267 RepID=UPI00146C5352|nr:GAF domain-containing protein [Actinopolymorpha alba]
MAEVNEAVRDGLDRDAVLALIARRARELVGASACAVMTLEEGEDLLVRAVDGAAVRQLRGTWVPTENTLEGDVVRSQQPMTVTDLVDDRDGVPLAAVGLRSVLLVPVPGYERPGGVIQVADGGGRRFTAEDVRVVSLFAPHVGMEVEHDRACSNLERLAITTPDTKPLEQTLDTLTRSVVAATGARACAVYLLDGDLSLRLSACYGPVETLEAGMAGVGSSGVPNLAQAAIAARSPIVQEEVLAELVGGRPESAGPRRQGSAGREAVLVCVPLMSRGVVLGVLCSQCPAGEHPSKLELAYLSIIAGKAASAVDSSQLVAAAQEKAALEERQRLARELHDSVSQALYGIALGARTARQVLDYAPEQVDQPIGYILQLAEAGLADMRALIFELRPQALAEEGLVVALHKQLAALHARHGVVTHADLGTEPAAALKVKQAFYRIAQEALQNIARHAHAHHVTMRLDSSAGELVLEISDDGTGFDPSASFPGHLGLRSMRERINEIGGALEIISAPGEGTRVRARGNSR